ncbi:MAG: secB [Proteobacteria bacterium]|nr:secB [Pseudomonadota bacterium]
MEQNPQAEQQTSQDPVFSIEKIYVKDLSVEVPNAPQIFLEQEPPQVEVQLNNATSTLGDGAYEVVLTITLTSKIKDKTVFLVEVGQAGIFRLFNIPEEQIDALLGVACPNILFPYAREVISDVVVRAGFPPLVMQPVNFEAIYMARQEEEKRVGAAPEATLQ